MWYFAWILGLPLAVAFAVLNAMWYELMEDASVRRDKLDVPTPTPTPMHATMAEAR